MTKYINQYFFDKESKRMYYILGSFYGCYIPQKPEGILFRSRYRDLVEIVKRELESGHTITSDPRKTSSHWIEAYRKPVLYSRLEKLGLNEPKEERKFPKKINEKYISHFVRGFFDAKVGSYTKNGKYIVVPVQFNNLFLLSLHKTLVKYAKVQSSGPTKNYFEYYHNDSIKICDFIYQDWDFIRKNGLYLPSKKELFKTDYVADFFSHLPATIKAREKVEKAKKLLVKGKKVTDVAKEVGYSQSAPLCIAFKKVTGQTTTEWQKNLK